MLKNVFGALVALVFVSGVSFADQIENEAMNGAPRGVLVKIDETAKVMEVYRVNSMTAGMSANSHATEKAEAIAAVARPENKIVTFNLATSELDKDSSTGAWWWGGWRRWNYYRPYYNTGYFGYYNYYYRYNWGYYSPYYNNCYYGWYY